MKQKYTKGPWEIEYRGDDGERGPAALGVIHGAKNSSDWVADVGSLHGHGGGGSIQNAKLISAAPELLEAVVRLLQWRNPEGIIADAYVPRWLAEKCEQTVIKATGNDSAKVRKSLD